MISNSEFLEILPSLQEACIEAGKLQKKYHKTDIDIATKSNQTPVTKIDIDSNIIISDSLKKITPEISDIRGVPMDRDCISPPGHTAFSGPLGLCAFIQQLREATHGKPIGFKLCIGVKSEFMSLCKAMIETGITPDFITVDGSEGGTGAAPLIFSNRVGTPGNEALHFVNNCLIGCGLRDKISLIASGNQ